MAESSVRKIFFEVDEKQALSAFEQLKKVSNDSARSIIENSNKYSKTGREVISSLNEEIRLRERKQKLEFQERKADVTENFEHSYGAAKTDAQRDRATSQFVGRMREVSRDEREVKVQSNLLREIVETLRQTARDEIRENRRGVEEQIKLYNQGKLKGLSPEEEAKIKIQSGMLGTNADGKGGDKSTFTPVFWGTLLANMAVKIIEKVGSVATADSGERGFNTLLGAIPFVGGVIESTRERALQARQDLQTNRLRYEAIGGRGSVGLFSGVGYGATSADLYDVAGQTARARAMSSGNAMSAVNIVALEKAYGLDRNQLMSISAGERFGGGGAMKDIGLVISVLKKQGLWDQNSQTKIPEYLSNLVTLQEEQVRKQGTIDNSRNMANVLAMAQLGGKFSKDTSYITGISSAIANPQNEFQQARSLSVLAGIKPGGDLWDLEMMQEKGLGQAGYMSGIVKQIKGRYGKGNLGERALYETLKGGGQNISKADARKIYQESLKDPQLWDKVVDERSLQDVIRKFGGETRTLGKMRTAELTKDITQSTEAYTQGALPGAINQLEKVIDKLNDTVAKWVGLNKEEQKVSQIIAKTNATAPYLPIISDAAAQISMAIVKFFDSNKENVIHSN